LREPRSSLRRANLALLTRCDLVEPAVVAELRREVERWAPGLPIATSEHRPATWLDSARRQRALEEVKGRPVAAFCGIGNPGSFRQTLGRLGLEVVAWRTFPDHHRYDRNDIEDLRRWARELSTDAIVATTQKDLVKIRLERLGDHELWALQIQLHITSGKETLEQMLQSVIRI
jgi:tetraacyldisaccharide 4'-kinase